MEYGSADEPSKPQLAFHRLQVEVVEKEKALRVATTKVGTLQPLLYTERQSSTTSPTLERLSFTTSPTLERELARLRHSYSKLSEVARDLGFDAVGLLCTHPSDDQILHISFGMLCRAVSNCLGHV